MSDSPEKVSESFRDAHRNAVLWSAICLAWVGFSVSPEKIKYLDFLVPSRIPLALLLTWVYLSWRFVAELMGNLAAVRSERWRKYDTVLALAIVGSAGVMLFADLSFRLPETRESGMPFIENSGYFGVMFASVCAAGFLRALRNTRKNKWIRRAIAVLELLTVGYWSPCFLRSKYSLGSTSKESGRRGVGCDRYLLDCSGSRSLLGDEASASTDRFYG